MFKASILPVKTFNCYLSNHDLIRDTGLKTFNAPLISHYKFGNNLEHPPLLFCDIDLGITIAYKSVQQLCAFTCDRIWKNAP